MTTEERKQHVKEYQHNYYKQVLFPAIKERKICGDCKQNKPVYGSLCANCKYKRDMKYASLTQEQKKSMFEKSKIANRKMYARRKEQGLCVDCGKHPAKLGRVRCQICLEKRSKKAKLLRYENKD